MSITFAVIDVVCQAADASFFVPQIALNAVSTTIYTTWYGYSEFIASSPPKKYKTVTFSGISERVGFTAEQIPRQCAGAKYVYSGVGTIDVTGKQLTNYAKNFFAQCAKAYWPQVPLQSNPNGVDPMTGPIPRLVGYCWPADPNSCPTCAPNDATWSFIGNESVNSPGIDLSGFMRLASDPVVTATSWSLNNTFYGLTSIIVDPPFSFEGVGGVGSTWNVSVGSANYPAASVVTVPGSLVFPAVAVGGIVDQYVVFTDTNNYSAVLSNEYTDAEAAANAKVVIGTGATAQNSPRTAGFTSVTTAVAFTLTMVNLIVGRDYLVTVDLWEQGPGVNTHTTRSYGVTAATATQLLHDTVPKPAAGHTITVQKPVIAFAP